MLKKTVNLVVLGVNNNTLIYKGDEGIEIIKTNFSEDFLHESIKISSYIFGEEYIPQFEKNVNEREKELEKAKGELEKAIQFVENMTLLGKLKKFIKDNIF